jgi:transposase IS4-like protein
MVIEKHESEARLPDGVSLNDLLSLFYLFITPDTLETVARNTNKNAALEYTKKNPIENPHHRYWHDLTGADIGAYFGALLIIGCQPVAGSVDEFWRNDEDHPPYPLAREISRQNFQQISRYLKINNPEDELADDDWWRKVAPVSDGFKNAAKQYFKPASTLSIDEQLISCKGRSKHTLQLKVKAAKKGYKIYSLCEGSYLIDFLFTSKKVQITELRAYKPTSDLYKHTEFTDSERVVLTLIDRFRERHPDRQHYMVVLDNFFTTHRLLSELKAWGFGAFGTAKKGAGIPKEHLYLRDVTTKEKDYGLQCNSVVEGVNCLTFVDQKAIWLLTTCHDTANDPLCWRLLIKRPGASQAKAETGDDDKWYLPFPQVCHDYNHGMNGADVCSQTWGYYTVSRHAHYRNWWPLLWAILDATIVNIHKIYRAKRHLTKDLSHKDLQTEIALLLLRNPAAVLRKRPRVEKIYGQRPTKIPKPEHKWESIKRTWCEVHKPHKGSGGRPSRALQDITNVANHVRKRRDRGKQTQKGCKQCKVALCYTSGCWQAYHSKIGSL